VESLQEANTAERLAGEAALADVALECHNESKAARRRVIVLLAGTPALYVSAQAGWATEAASWTGRPERVVGWGALRPLAAGGAVEVAAAMQTAPAPAGMAETFGRVWDCNGAVSLIGPDRCGRGSCARL
jgi:hypothetical protein